MVVDRLIDVIDGSNLSKILSAAIVLLATVSVLALMLFSFWKLERAAANYQNRTGDPFAWIGWGIVAASPMIIVALVIYRIDPDGETFYFDTLYAILTAFVAPLLVHASGRAIDQHGPSFADIWSYWSPRYFTLVIGYLLATAPFCIASDLILHLEGVPLSQHVSDVLASLLYLVGSVLATVLTVEAFHRAEHAQVEAT